MMDRDEPYVVFSHRTLIILMLYRFYRKNESYSWKAVFCVFGRERVGVGGGVQYSCVRSRTRTREYSYILYALVFVVPSDGIISDQNRGSPDIMFWTCILSWCVCVRMYFCKNGQVFEFVTRVCWSSNVIKMWDSRNSVFTKIKFENSMLMIYGRIEETIWLDLLVIDKEWADWRNLIWSWWAKSFLQ